MRRSSLPSAKSLALTGVKTAAAVGDALRPPKRGVVVLIYHRVGRRTPVEVDLTADLFTRQMELLAETERACSLDRALAALEQTAPSGPDPVVVTFDDGTADFAEVAVPILARFSVPATLYVATDFIERGRPFPNDGVAVSWAALADTMASGLVTVGSHTHTHALLDRLPAGDIASELDRSIGLIGERLGVTAEHFAYPKAVPGSQAADSAVRSRFRSAALAGTRTNRYGSTDPYRLARSPVQVADGMRWFGRKLAGGMALEDGLRRLVNRGRYTGATT
ncbi:MAG: polysaccharide deacetylase family protein [Acidimicrobiia bacterium]